MIETIDMTYEEGFPQSVRINCTVKSSVKPIISWVFNDKPLPSYTNNELYEEPDIQGKYTVIEYESFNDDNYIVKYDLIIADVMTQDAGKYVCRVDNVLNQIQMAETNIYVCGLLIFYSH